MMWTMSAPGDSELPPSAAPGRQASISSDGPESFPGCPARGPSARGPRRTAAREASAAAKAATPAPAHSNGRPPADSRKLARAVPAKATPKRPARRTAKPAVAVEPAPRQGFESEGERTSRPVQPPGGRSWSHSAAEIVGELAKAGSSTGERLLKDVAVAAAALLSPLCILPRNAEPSRLRSGAGGGPNADRVDPLGRIGPAGP